MYSFVLSFDVCSFTEWISSKAPNRKPDLKKPALLRFVRPMLERWFEKVEGLTTRSGESAFDKIESFYLFT